LKDRRELGQTRQFSVFKNGDPSSELVPAMQFLSS